jgi:ArsR family transcriptional regulator, arsenate/arsenite/antimonite-responsive transcriptional repressor
VPASLESPRTHALPDEDAVLIARALSHTVRVRILRILGAQETCFCGDLCQEIPLAQSTISQHLKVLREAGLIQGTPCGTAVGYCVVIPRLEAYRRWAASLPRAVDQPLDPVPGHAANPSLGAASERLENRI